MTGATVGRVWATAGMKSSIRTDWATPRSIFEMLDREFHFDLDACATEATATLPRNFVSMALDQAWEHRVWCNPPYGRTLGRWVEKAYRESRLGSLVVMLLPARTDTQWFHDYCLRGEIRFLRGRLEFDDAKRGRDGRACRCPFPSMVVVFRPITASSYGVPQDASSDEPNPVPGSLVKQE